MKTKLFTFIGIWIFLTNTTCWGQELLWLSNVPPEERQEEIKANGMHKLSSISAGRGKVKLVQWARLGSSVLNAGYALNSELADTELYCYSPGGELQECRVDSALNHVEIGFGNPEEGYYNLYMVQKHVRNDTLLVRVAKAELLNHSCRNGHKHEDKKRRSHIHPDKIPIELTRKRNRLENLHFFVSSGDEILYSLTGSSGPLVNASLTFYSHHGWQRHFRSNEEGEAVVELIQDYFTPWGEIDNRKIYHYLAMAEYTEEREGEFKGQSYRYTHYVTTLSDGYYPSKVMYSSLSWGLGLFLIFSILIGGGVAIYRKRKMRSYNY